MTAIIRSHKEHRLIETGKYMRHTAYEIMLVKIPTQRNNTHRGMCWKKTESAYVVIKKEPHTNTHPITKIRRNAFFIYTRDSSCSYSMIDTNEPRDIAARRIMVRVTNFHSIRLIRNIIATYAHSNNPIFHHTRLSDNLFRNRVLTTTHHTMILDKKKNGVAKRKIPKHNPATTSAATIPFH